MHSLNQLDTSSMSTADYPYYRQAIFHRTFYQEEFLYRLNKKFHPENPGMELFAYRFLICLFQYESAAPQTNS